MPADHSFFSFSFYFFSFRVEKSLLTQGNEGFRGERGGLCELNPPKKKGNLVCVRQCGVSLPRGMQLGDWDDVQLDNIDVYSVPGKGGAG